MSVAHRTLRFRLLPGGPEKAKWLYAMAGACRFVRNAMIAAVRDEYREAGKADVRYFSLTKRFTALRHAPDTDWLESYPYRIPMLALKGLAITYREAFKTKGRRGLPRFHSKWHSIPSFLIDNQCARIEGESLRISGLGWVRLAGQDRYAGGRFLSGTVKCERGKWFAYLVREVEASDEIRPGEIGIDRNVGQFATSAGEIHYLPDLTAHERRKRRYQRAMARRDAGSRRHRRPPSNRYRVMQRRHAKVSAKIAAVRRDAAHQASRRLADSYGTVYLEDLRTAAMTRSAKGTSEAPGKNVRAKAGLNRAILASGWGLLGQCLAYKAQVVPVPAPYTSQTCSACGYVHAGNRTSQARFACLSCGNAENADVNAAKNILALGRAITARGIGAAGRGGGKAQAPPVKRQQEPLSEAA